MVTIKDDYELLRGVSHIQAINHINLTSPKST